METISASHSLTSMSSSPQPALSLNPNRNSTSPGSHERVVVKKKSRKRKNLLNRYGSSKRRRLASASSRRKGPTVKGEPLPNSSLAEPLSLSNGEFVSGSNFAPKAFQEFSEKDEGSKSAGKNKHRKCKDLEVHVHLGIDNRVTSCSQAAQLDNAEVICSPFSLLPISNASEPVQQSSRDRVQDTPDGRVLRPSRLRSKEIKKNLPPPADSLQIVGRRIEVYWPLDAAWYCGLISAYDDIRKKHKVSYDDGEEEWLCLSHEKFRFEVSFGTELAQSSGKAQESEDGKNSCAFRDDLLVSAVPSTSPPQGSKGLSNGTFTPVLSTCERPAAGSVEDTSPQADAHAANMFSPEATLREESTGLKAQKDTKFFLRRHKGTPIGQSKDGGDVNAANNVEAGRVYVRRKKPGLRGGSPVADLQTSEVFQQVQSFSVQERQNSSNSRRKQKHPNQVSQYNDQAVHSYAQGPRDMETLNGTVEECDLGAAAYMGQPGLTSPRKQNQWTSNDEAGIARVSLEGSVCMLDSMYSGVARNAGVSAHCISGQPTRRARRKHKVRSLADTTLAAGAVKDKVRMVAGPCDQDHKQKVFEELAMVVAEPSGLSQQKGAMLLSCQETEAPVAGKSAAETPRRKSIADKLELPAAAVSEKLGGRKSKRGWKSAGGHSRGRHQHRKAIKKRQRLQAFASSLPLALNEAALTHCLSVVGLHTGGRLFDKAVTKRASCTSDSSTLEGNPFHLQGAHQLARQHSSTSDWNVEPNSRLCLQSPLRAFYSTIHLRRPDMVFDLFTWQLFNMLEAVGLCQGDCFEGRFSWMGSTQDLANIVLLFMTIVKALPFTSQRCHQRWQGRVLHEIWSVFFMREQGRRNLPPILSPEADDLLMQHLKRLISGHCVSNMTSRQMLNIFSSYILKPYVIAILCEKGAQLTTVVQQFLLLTNPLKDGISFKRQFVKWVKLSSQAGAEAVFSSYLFFFPMAEHWCTGTHNFEKLMKDRIFSVPHAGYAQQSIPIPSFTFSSNQGLQFTTALVVCKKFTPPSDLYTIRLQQIDGSFGADSLSSESLRLLNEARYLLSRGKFACFNQVQTCLDFYTGLCFNSMLQKCLHLAGGKSVESHCDKGAGTVADGHLIPKCSSLKVDDVKESCDWELESRLTFKSIPNESPHCIANDYSYFKGREVITEEHFLKQISSEENITDAIKDESLLKSCDQRFDKGAASNTLMGSSPFYLIDELVDNASGASSSSSYECATKWKSTKMAEIAFRGLDTRDQHRQGNYGGISYLTFGQHSEKRVGPKRRPRGGELESTDMEHFDLCCTANVLITKSDRSWREVGIRVELQSRGSEWVISVQIEGVILSHKVLESTITSRVNRYNHAMMWKGGDDWTLEFCDRTQWICFKGMHEECSHRNARAAFVKQIPIPSVKQIKESIEGMSSVCSWLGSTGGQWPGEIEAALICTRRVYDMDCEDESWLAEVNRKANCIKETISVDAFERIVDKLERITYLRQGEMVVTDEVAELCENLASENAVLTVHAYWFKKRLSKDNALIRYFESPLWKKYWKQSESWHAEMSKLQRTLPNATNEELLKKLPKPPLFAFCYPSRGLDASNLSKRMQRQRSQKHLNSSFKYLRTSSFETSEESQRVSLLRSRRVCDSLPNQDWYQASQFPQSAVLGYEKGDYWQRKMSRDGFFEQLVSNLCPQSASLDGYTSLETAQANLGEARQLAQMYFLRFDSALQRALAAVIEFENIYSADLALINLTCESPTASYEQLLIFRKRIDHVLNQFFSLSGKEDFLTRDGNLGSLSDDPDDDNDDDDPLYTVSTHADGLVGSPISDDFLKEEGTFLSISERAHLEAWMRTTLRQRAC